MIKNLLKWANWNLIMLQKNKAYILIPIFLLISNYSLLAQVRFSAWSNNYIELRSYLGMQTLNRFNTFQFQVSGQHTFIPQWSLTVRLMEPIRVISGESNRGGKEFPAEKISLYWTEDNNDPDLFLQGIGANRNPIPLQSHGEVKLIDHANQSLSSHGEYHRNFQLYNALKIEPGRYLDKMVSASPYHHLRYKIALLFTLYNQEGVSLGTAPLEYVLQISPRLTDGHLIDIEPDFSIRFIPEASRVSLRFSTSEDYKEGVRFQASNALRITSNTDYEVKVKSMDSHFVSEKGTTLPLDILTLKLMPGQDAVHSGVFPKISLSANEQTLCYGQSADKDVARYYHLEYEAKLKPEQLMQIKKGSYDVSILYLLMPK